MDEAGAQNDELEETVAALGRILRNGVSKDPFLDLETLKNPLVVPPFEPGEIERPLPSPDLHRYLPPAPSGFAKLVPGAKKRHEALSAEAQSRFLADSAAHRQNEEKRRSELARLRSEYDAKVEKERRRVEAQHAEIGTFKEQFRAADPAALASYFGLVLERSDYPDGFPGTLRIAYVPESKQLVVELDLPSFDVIPEAGTFKYVKSKDEIAEVARPMKDRRALYSSVIAQTALRSLHEIFSADRDGLVGTVVLNGYVEAIDKGTGRKVRPCVVTVRVTREAFLELDLTRVEPTACLRTVHASLSKSPDELAPVRPVLEFSMVDPRFIEEADVLSGLDRRPNLMDLTPSEFENLITNLFEKMGLETRLTRASRDGGVDCVAWDSRPILGGKVVIQAKRYKNTVGVSAVRDLFGTLQNEGASKGILVTTSGYGKASFEFAEGKPIELLSGSNLLYLLAQHAGLEARIVVPDDWKDPSPDSGE